MRYVTLGASGLQVSRPVPRYDDVRARRPRHRPANREPPHHRRLPRRRRQLHRHGQRVRGRRVRGGGRPGDQVSPRRRRARHQGIRADRNGTTGRAGPTRPGLGGASIWSGPWRPACAASGRTTSTSTSATGPTPTPPSPRRWRRCTASCSRARSATSAAPTGPDRRSSRRSGRPRSWAAPPSSASSRGTRSTPDGSKRTSCPTCQRQGLGTMIYCPLGGGVLTGKYKPGPAAAGGQPGCPGRDVGPNARRPEPGTGGRGRHRRRLAYSTSNWTDGPSSCSERRAGVAGRAQGCRWGLSCRA